MRIHAPAACLVEEERARWGKIELHVIAFAIAGFRAGLEKTNDAEGTVRRVEDLPAHRLGGGDMRGRSTPRPLQALRPDPQHNRAADRLRPRDARLTKLDPASVGFPLHQVDRWRSGEARHEQ